MAEAAIITRYFCHQCSQETTSVLPDYTCPRCRSGFIEMIANDDTNQLNNEQSSFVSDYDSSMDHSYDREVPQMSDIFNEIYGFNSSPLNRHSSTRNSNSNSTSRQSSPSNGTANTSQNDLSNGESTRGRSRVRISSDNGSQSSPSRPRTRYFQFNFPRVSDANSTGNSNSIDNQQTLEGIFQQILTNVASGQGLASREGGRGLINIDFPLPLFQVLHGNPGDYAWGSGGLDVVITQLLNQLDSTGPPPMPKEEIEKLSYVAITAEQVSKNLQCTVCMEDFKSGEKVRCLMCTHCYHNDCIIPWLQMHATCPVCRKELTSNRIVNQTANNYRGSVNNESQSQSENSNANQSTTNNSYEFTDDYD